MRSRKYRLVAVALCAVLALGACAGDGGSPADADRAACGDTTCDGRIPGPTTITAWFHESGAERDTLSKQVGAFNASQRDVRVRLIPLPEGEYAGQVRSAAATGNLPDVLDLDGPDLYNHAWSGRLKPLGSCVPAAVRADLLDSIREHGTYAWRLFGVGTCDSGPGLYVRRSAPRKIGARVPTGPGDTWTAEGFTGILGRLRSAGYRRPLDLRLRNSPAAAEWNTYGFAPPSGRPAATSSTATTTAPWTGS